MIFNALKSNVIALLLSFPFGFQVLVLMPPKSTFFVVFQVLFSEMFRLPNPHHVQVFYGSLIIELCKSQPNTMPGVVSL